LRSALEASTFSKRDSERFAQRVPAALIDLRSALGSQDFFQAPATDFALEAITFSERTALKAS